VRELMHAYLTVRTRRMRAGQGDNGSPQNGLSRGA
jgi:hypothetical protein